MLIAPLEPLAWPAAVRSAAEPLAPPPALAPLCRFSSPPSPPLEAVPPEIETAPPLPAPSDAELEPPLIATLPPGVSVPAAAPDDRVRLPEVPPSELPPTETLMSPAAVDEPVAMSTEPLAPLAERPVPSTRRPVSAPDAVLASDEDSETSPVDAPAGPPLPLPIDTEPLGPDAAVPPVRSS